MTDELRSCARTGCRWPAAASLSFRYDTRQVWLVDLPDSRDPTLYDLCPHHARTLTVPRGWEHADERTNPPAPHEPSGRDLADRAAVRHGGVSRYAPLLRDLPRIAAELAGASPTRDLLSSPRADPVLAEEPVAEHPGQLRILLESGPNVPGDLAEAMGAWGPVVSIASGGARRRLLSRGSAHGWGVAQSSPGDHLSGWPMAVQAARADTPPKTLTSTEEDGPMGGCPNCASTDLVSIDMTLRGGSMRFAHCRRCEHRWWTDPSRGVHVPFAEVLSRA